MSLRRLLRTYLLPYKRTLLIVLALQSVQTFATLMLPYLSADLINHGVLRGDNAHIWRVGAIMIGFALVQIVFAIAAVRYGARVADGFRARRPPRPVPPGDRLLGPGGRHVRRPVADHPHHQRRAADPDGGRDVHDDDGRGAADDGDRGRAGGPRRRRALGRAGGGDPDRRDRAAAW